MTQTVFDPNLTPSLALLDANFAELYAGVTVADAAFAHKWKAATGRLRLRPYVDATNGSVLDAYNTAEAALIPFTLSGSAVRFVTAFGVAGVFDASGRLGVAGTPSLPLDVFVTAAGDVVRARNNTSSIESKLGVSADSGYFDSGNADAALRRNGTEAARIVSGLHFRPATDNTQTLGAAANRWSVVYAGTGTINTSDAREKTEVAPMTANEIAAAKQLAGEFGTFRFLSAVAEKGAAARMHIGMTVQRAMDIMIANGLDPLNYGFICHDRWPDVTIAARTEPRKTGLFNAQGEEMVEQVEVEPARVIKGGDRYGFRPDELLLFLARGFDARLAALEA